MSDLTARQVDVLTLIAQGRTAGQIAERLGTGESTVRSQLADIRQRLGATTVAQAVAVAYQRGILGDRLTNTAAVALVELAAELGYRLALIPKEDA
jgi:DNA-binding CsgD family transcriptional regulator